MYKEMNSIFLQQSSLFIPCAKKNSKPAVQKALNSHSGSWKASLSRCFI